MKRRRPFLSKLLDVLPLTTNSHSAMGADITSEATIPGADFHRHFHDSSISTGNQPSSMAAPLFSTINSTASISSNNHYTQILDTAVTGSSHSPIVVLTPGTTNPASFAIVNTFRRRIRRLAVWIAILVMISYKFWTGRTHFPLTCNLFSLRCPSWPISGEIADGFDNVLDAFKANFEEGNEVGASFAAYVGDTPVVELYGGYHNKRYSKPYDKDSLQLVFSSSKFVEGIVITYLIDQGLLDFNERITTYWPEFGQGNKENVTVQCLLGHRAGVTYLSRQPTLDEIANLDQLAKLLAAQPHNFNGTLIQGYHAVTRGWYLNEIVRRVDRQKRTIGQIVRQEFMPLLDAEYYLALPKHLEPRLSKLIHYPHIRTVAKILAPKSMLSDPLPNGFAKVLFDRQSVSFKAVAGSQPKQIIPWPHSHNRRAIWATEGPSYSGITNAKSLAKFAALMAQQGTFNGHRIISPETVRKSLVSLPFMPDTVVSRNVTFATGGWGVGVSFPGSEHVGWIGWGGVGGSMVWWSPDLHISFAYVMNSLSLSGIGDKRSWRLIAALVKAVETMS
ncbi:hypothetical protein BATDEDRAFT_18969 [Batrachochytrium dendrobatidis JAM81]|uniref:Beta-lactamase-related domain-containing protein n=2 Tax=Batrachochytrium dendrobatidis TaxID=109871 RepID=F4NYT0_BATDJ|nr:uncharacterized protein BATDEDRAFT_18969 [Batrachochytrium dendrobatidis JAM81]EGF82083.1 hypothetical protein BATDEDRAFT_18969 [Batrachochytrium dendrobatidis JAM81]KAJ8324805.1 hypothetical protein O5D80_007033 [Batrachochytrium dendrobatidis]KAK5671041.1 hypothetical protein QVD99_002807 [Batrachochytrium dendrobatidis]|eukprot:XP_006677196.1 hypothetical protein BATDEDRAFT_18969 [Batrachochytrium dendrobatidis JAM81]